MATFFDYIQKSEGSRQELPAVHTTVCFRLSDIRVSNSLEPQQCQVFHEPLLYLFYGRPAYRDPRPTKPTRDIGFYPICFVLKPEVVLAKAKRMYPFDTGASKVGLYEPPIKFSELKNFELATAIESAQKLVACFFDNDANYLSNATKPGLSFSASENHAESYYSLICGGGDPRCDDRCSAVEIQLAEAIDLKDSLMAIVLPTSFLDDKDLAKTIVKDWGAQPLTYNADVGMRPMEFHAYIRKLIRDFYETRKLI